MNLISYNYDAISVARLAVAMRSAQTRPARLAAVQARRFSRLVSYARARSPFYSRTLHGHSSEIGLADLPGLPTTTKAQVMEHFDDVITDRSLSLDQVLRFAEDRKSVGQALSGKYFVAHTSGTSGLVGHYLHDLFSYSLIHTLTAVRSGGVNAGAFVGRSLVPRRMRIASLLSPIMNLGVASVMAAAPAWARAAVSFRLVNILDPVERVIASLNEFRPDVIGSFPSILEELAESQRAGQLQVEPRTIRCGGETLSPRARQNIAEAFRCSVYDAYGCAEAGWLGMECDAHNGIHLFSDWMLVEPVDQDRKPVPPMVESDLILVTNLANYVQPFIRFEIPDRVTVLESKCSCGSGLPRVLVKGRTSEVLYLRGDNGAVIVPPFHLTTLAEMVAGIGRFQVVMEDDRHLSVRFAPRAGVSLDEVAHALKVSFFGYLRNRDLSAVTLTIVATDVIEKDASGKARQVLVRAARG